MYDGQIFDAYVQIAGLIKQAKHSIVLVDNYIDETTLTMLSKRDVNISATIYTSQQAQNLRQLQLDIQRHNQQYPPIAVNYCQRNHDRFLIIDDVVYLFGASLKDAGKKLFAYIKMQETSASELLSDTYYCRKKYKCSYYSPSFCQSVVSSSGVKMMTGEGSESSESETE